MPRINKNKEINSKNSKVNKKEITGDLFETTKIKEDVPFVITNLVEKNKLSNNKIGEIEKGLETVTNKDILLKEDDRIFTLKSPVYLQIHKGNLLQYLSNALIFPSKYSTQKAFTDAQSVNQEGLLLSNGYIIEDLDQILMQIDPDAINTAYLAYNSECAFYTSCLPISSVIKIIVTKADLKKKLLEDAIIREGGFLPEKLISVGIPKNIFQAKPLEIIIEKQELQEEIIKYDKILGLIAGTNNYNLLTFNQTGLYKSVSDHSLYAVQAINPDFGKETISNVSISEYYKWLFSKSCPEDRVLLKWIFERVYNNENFTDKDTEQFERLYFKSNTNIEEESEVKNIFESLKNSVSRKKALMQALSIQSKHALAIYVFVYLRIYGTRQNPELARVDLAYIRLSKYTEYAFATINFFFGYKQLRNSEDRNGIEKVQVLREHKYLLKPVIKFELTYLFDYLLIDNVFNYVFKTLNLEEKNYKIYNNLSKNITDIKNKAVDSSKLSKLLYGKEYFNIKKINPLDELAVMLESLPNDISIFSEFGVCCYRLNLKLNKVSFSDIFNTPTAIFKMFSYSKSELLNAIRENRIDLDEVKMRITLAKKYKEL